LAIGGSLFSEVSKEQQMRQGRLFVFSGPSGVGKGTICRELVKDPSLRLSVSMTTRTPREGEQEGISYFFVTREQFQKTVEENGLLEHAEIYGNCYGTPRKAVMDSLRAGFDVILEIEMQGALQVKRSFPEAILVFVLPPSLEVLRQRLSGRGTETEEQMRNRLSSSLEEIRLIKDYDYFVINDDLAAAVADAMGIIKAERLKVAGSSEEIISRYEEENKCFFTHQ
jgi:guanylate kinase